MSSDQENGTVKLQPIVQPVFPRANQILFYTGNTLTSLKLMKKTNTSITEEVISVDFIEEKKKHVCFSRD